MPSRIYICNYFKNGVNDMKSKAGKILLKVFAAIIVVLVLIAGGFGIYFAN